jgi:hypothetical protein
MNGLADDGIKWVADTHNAFLRICSLVRGSDPCAVVSLEWGENGLYSLSTLGAAQLT